MFSPFQSFDEYFSIRAWKRGTAIRCQVRAQIISYFNEVGLFFSVLSRYRTVSMYKSQCCVTGTGTLGTVTF